MGNVCKMLRKQNYRDLYIYTFTYKHENILSWCKKKKGVKTQVEGMGINPVVWLWAAVTMYLGPSPALESHPSFPLCWAQGTAVRPQVPGCLSPPRSPGRSSCLLALPLPAITAGIWGTNKQWVPALCHVISCSLSPHLTWIKLKKQVSLFWGPKLGYWFTLMSQYTFSLCRYLIHILESKWLKN